MARRGKKGLSAEDRELWERVKRTTTPMVRSPLAKPASGDPETSPPPNKQRDSTPIVPEPLRPFRIGASVAAPSAPHSRHDVTDKIAQAPIRMKQTTHRRMTRGKMKPEARIDLHGMTLSEAHPALVDFVLRSHARDLRLLLVITGKGRGGERQDDGPIPIRRGVLKQQVPGWLTAPPLGAIVLEIREAHARHGGGGAFYVYLRRSR